MLPLFASERALTFDATQIGVVAVILVVAHLLEIWTNDDAERMSLDAITRQVAFALVLYSPRGFKFYTKTYISLSSLSTFSRLAVMIPLLVSKLSCI